MDSEAAFAASAIERRAVADLLEGLTQRADSSPPTALVVGRGGRC